MTTHTGLRPLTVAAAIAAVAIMVCAPLIAVADDGDATAKVTEGQSAVYFEAKDLTEAQMANLDKNFDNKDYTSDVLKALGFSYGVYTITPTDVVSSSYGITKAVSYKVDTDSITYTTIKRTSYHIEFKVTNSSSTPKTMFSNIYSETIGLIDHLNDDNQLKKSETLQVKADIEIIDQKKVTTSYAGCKDKDLVVTDVVTEETEDPTTNVKAEITYKDSKGYSSDITAEAHHMDSLKSKKSYDFLGYDKEKVSSSSSAFVSTDILDGKYVDKAKYHCISDYGYDFEANGHEMNKFSKIEGGDTETTTAQTLTGDLECPELGFTDLFSDRASAYSSESALKAYLDSIGTTSTSYSDVNDTFDSLKGYGNETSERNKFLIVLGITAAVVVVIAGIALIISRRH